MPLSPPCPENPNVRRVDGFEALAGFRFSEGVNALCWERVLPSGFDEVAALLGPGEGIVPLEAATLGALKAGPAARAAIAFMLADFARLEALGLDPALNLIHAYPHDEDGGPVATDVYSFHADSAPVPAETWLCTYHGAPTEGLCSDEAVRRTDDPATRAALLRAFGGAEGPEFEEHLREACYDLHYAPRPGARPYSFGVGNLWRIALSHPGCPVPPCVHRAPASGRSDPPRLLLIA